MDLDNVYNFVNNILSSLFSCETYHSYDDYRLCYNIKRFMEFTQTPEVSDIIDNVLFLTFLIAFTAFIICFIYTVVSDEKQNIQELEGKIIQSTESVTTVLKAMMAIKMAHNSNIQLERKLVEMCHQGRHVPQFILENSQKYLQYLEDHEKENFDIEEFLMDVQSNIERITIRVSKSDNSLLPQPSKHMEVQTDKVEDQFRREILKYSDPPKPLRLSVAPVQVYTAPNIIIHEPKAIQKPPLRKLGEDESIMDSIDYGLSNSIETGLKKTDRASQLLNLFQNIRERTVESEKVSFCSTELLELLENLNEKVPEDKTSHFVDLFKNLKDNKSLDEKKRNENDFLRGSEQKITNIKEHLKEQVKRQTELIDKPSPQSFNPKALTPNAKVEQILDKQKKSEEAKVIAVAKTQTPKGNIKKKTPAKMDPKAPQIRGDPRRDLPAKPISRNASAIKKGIFEHRRNHCFQPNQKLLTPTQSPISMEPKKCAAPKDEPMNLGKTVIKTFKPRIVDGKQHYEVDTSILIIPRNDESVSSVNDVKPLSLVNELDQELPNDFVE